MSGLGLGLEGPGLGLGLGLEGPGLGLEGLGLGLEANFEAEVKSLDTNIQQSIIDKQRYSILDL